MTQTNGVAERAVMALRKATKPNTFLGLKSSDVEDFLAPYVPQIQKALPANTTITPNRVLAMAVYQISQNPALSECSPKSVIGALMQTALLGLNPALKQCWYVPYRKGSAEAECQFQISYTGLINLASRSGRVLQVYANVVRQGDFFEVEQGLNRNLVHKPKLGNDGPLQYAYAVIKYASGGFDFVVLTASDIEKRRKSSPGQRGRDAVGVWADWTEEMWKKTALRNLLKTAILSDDTHGQAVAKAVAVDEGTVNVDEIQDGEPVAIAYAEEDAVIVEAPDLEQIREGVEQCGDIDALDRFWQQGAKEWALRDDVKALFTERKKELSK